MCEFEGGGLRGGDVEVDAVTTFAGSLEGRERREGARDEGCAGVGEREGGGTCGVANESVDLVAKEEEAAGNGSALSACCAGDEECLFVLGHDFMR